MKIQTKITLVFFAISAAGLLLVHAAIFYFVSEFNFEDFFKRLESGANLSGQVHLHAGEKSAAYRDIRNRYLGKLENERDYIIRLDAKGNPPMPRPLKLPEKFYDEALRLGKARHIEKNVFYAGAYFNTPREKFLVIVSASDPYGFQELAQLKKVQIVSFFVSILLTFLAGTFFSRFIMKPVRGIIKSVKNISANNLHSRLDEWSGTDEIAELVQTFNNMLTRLETSFETQNNFVSNASHELRTPLSIITAETELLLSRGSLAPEAAASAKTVLAEAGKLEQILQSLLGLAQSGFDGKKQNWQQVRADELVIEVINSVKKIEPTSVIRLDLSELPQDASRLYTTGNINLLQLALSNIVLNACKYSGNQPVAIRVTVTEKHIVISVTDTGIGIPRDEQQHIFEPFFRGSNAASFEGYGIGLPLTLNIIRLHKGTIGIRSEENIGTEMQLVLPATA